MALRRRYRVAPPIIAKPASIMAQLAGSGMADTVLIVGHWSALGLKVLPQLLAIDSGCLWGGALTAIRLEDRAIFQVPCSPEESRAW